MATQKVLVYVTHGVYVDLDEAVDLDSDIIRERAIERLLTIPQTELVSESDMEVEDVTDEFTE